MDVTLYAFYFDAEKFGGKKRAELSSFEYDLCNVVNYVIAKDKLMRKKEYLRDKKVVYLHDFEHVEEDNQLILIFRSARFAKIRNVIDTDTLLEKPDKKKSLEDGDEESTRIIVKFTDDSNAICLLESNKAGIGISKIRNYLNDWIKEYHNEEGDKILYRIETNNIVSADFLKNLSKARRIKGVTLTVDQEDVKVSESKEFAGRNDIRENIDILLKPKGRGNGIFNKTIKDFYNLYKDASSGIKRIYIVAEEDDGSPLRFDTEAMKEKYIIDISETYTGEPKEVELVAEMKKIIGK